MRAPKVVVVDFETEAIEARPVYPPVPVGVSILMPGRKPRYFSWGHDSANNCDKGDAYQALLEAYASGLPLLFHNAKFDLEVALVHFGLAPPAEFHDTMILLFLDDPHASTFALKPASEALLGMPPEEQDAVADWLIENKFIMRSQRAKAGAFIARAPGSTVVGPYANGDTERTLKLFQLLFPRVTERGMLEAYRRELALLPILLRSERDGIRVDVDGLAEDVVMYRSAWRKADDWLRKRLGAPELNLNADAELADALEAAGLVTDWVLLPSGAKSVSKENLHPSMFSDPRVARVLGYRNRLATCVATFMEPWLEQAQANRGRVHTSWNQVRQSGWGGGGSAGARTGRLSSARPNFMNLPKNFYDKGDGYEHPKHIQLPELPTLRTYFLPDRGGAWLHRDYSQQELRILAHYEDGALMAAYRDPKPPAEWCDKDGKFDVHLFVAKLIEAESGRALERRQTKIINFGMIYGMGAGGLANDLGCTVEEAKSLRKSHRIALPGIGALEAEIKTLCRVGEPITTWGGRKYFAEPPKEVKGRIMNFEYKLLNYLIQGSAADCTKQAVINYDAVRKDGRFLATVHDEINISAPKRAAKAEMKLLREAMEDIPFDVPMLSDGKSGPSWGELTKEKK